LVPLWYQVPFDLTTLDESWLERDRQNRLGSSWSNGAIQNVEWVSDFARDAINLSEDEANQPGCYKLKLTNSSQAIQAAGTSQV
jgi:hypothetical protein